MEGSLEVRGYPGRGGERKWWGNGFSRPRSLSVEDRLAGRWDCSDWRQNLGKGYFTAFPMMWGPVGNQLKVGGCRSICSSENWAFSRSFQVSLVRQQPSPMCFQVGSRTCCHKKAQLPRGSATCSQKKNTPPCQRRELVSLVCSFHNLPPFSPLPDAASHSPRSEAGAAGLRVYGTTCCF